MIYWDYYPKIDLHGEYAITGTGKLKEEVHHILKNDKRVLEFHLDPMNLGQTLVRLKLTK